MEGKQALVVGGTSGIGYGIALALSKQRCNVVIAGRSKEKGEKIVSLMQAEHSEGEFAFEPINAMSLHEIRQFAKSFRDRHEHLHYLVQTQGIMTTKPRTETPEGIDEKLAVHYYGRHFLIRELLPLLEKTAVAPDVDVRVLSVLACAKGGPAPQDDFDLKTHFSVYNASQVAPFHNDLMVDSFAQKHPSISWLHGYPGFVGTDLGRDLPWGVRHLAGLSKYFATKPEAIGEVLCRSLVDDQFREGWHFVSERGAPTAKLAAHTDEMRDRVFQHTVELTDAVFAGDDAST